VLLDPTLDEESKQTGSVTLAFMPSLNEVTHLHQQGEMELSKIQEVRLL
jgi:ribonuclease PH